MGSPHVVELLDAFVSQESSLSYDDSEELSAEAASSHVLVLNLVLEKFGQPLSSCLKGTMLMMKRTIPSAHVKICCELTVKFLTALSHVHKHRIAHRVRPAGLDAYAVPFALCDALKIAGSQAIEHPCPVSNRGQRRDGRGSQTL